MKPVIADNKPSALSLKPGTYYWCACGKSKNQPFCDGSHRDTEFTPVPFEIKEEKTVYLCQCKHTKKPPFCDGSHHKL